MKNLQCKLTRKRWLEIGVSALLFVLIIAWALVLEYTDPGLDGGPPHRPAVSRGRDPERPVEGRNA